MFTNILKSTLETAAAKALATNGPEGINVVPVSMIRVNENDIWLFEFFMDKTAKNAEAGKKAVLTIKKSNNQISFSLTLIIETGTTLIPSGPFVAKALAAAVSNVDLRMFVNIDRSYVNN